MISFLLLVIFSLHSLCHSAAAPPYEYVDASICEKCESHANNAHLEYGKSYYPPEHGKRVCASNSDYFANLCWLELYNQVYKTDLTVATDDFVCSGLTGPFFGCPCSALCAFIYNPICIYNVDTGEEVTIGNYCLYKCGNGCTFSRQIKHCGPCRGSNETLLGECDGDGSLNCLPHDEPQHPCIPPGQPKFQSCCKKPCTLEFFPICGKNKKTGAMHTFPNQCTINCEIECSYGEWESMGGNGYCPCLEDTAAAIAAGAI